MKVGELRKLAEEFDGTRSAIGCSGKQGLVASELEDLAGNLADLCELLIDHFEPPAPEVK